MRQKAEGKIQRFVRDRAAVSVSVEPIASTILNVRAVAPKRMIAPSVSLTGPSTADPFTIVPFLLPRSRSVAV